jgi:hypothetical protein
MKAKRGIGTRVILAFSGLYLLNNGACLPDNFYADLAGGLITVGAELIVSDVVADAIAGTDAE